MTDAVAATAAETGSFTYDANGNLKTAPAPYSITAVTYDPANLPLSITRSGTTSTYRYDGAGQRIAKQVGTGNTEVYVLDGAVTLGVFTVNSGGTATAWYFNLHAGDRVVGRQPSTGSRSYYHSDLLGSTRAVVQGAAVVESYDFEPWGLLMPGRTLGSGTKDGFTGKERDAETGLDYFGARYYMPALGRWASVDPLVEKHPEWSPYNYVLNNPVVLLDPDGRQVSANDPGRLLPRLQPSRPWVLGELGSRAIVGVARDPATRDLAAGFTPIVSSAQDATVLFTGENPVTGDRVGAAGRFLALIGLLTPLSSGQLRAAGRALSGTDPHRIYSARVLMRQAEESGPFHNFPQSFDRTIFKGNRQVVSDDYVLYTQKGSITLPGRELTLPSGEVVREAPRVVEGTYEIGVRPSASGRTEVIVHRLFRPDQN